MNRLEILVAAGLVIACVVMGIIGINRKDKHAYSKFIAAAKRVEKALNEFARDHNGCYPPDAGPCDAPHGLDGRYIAWERRWKIDYEAKDNGKGGKFVCLEFGGPYRSHRYFKLCEDPGLRALYPKGQPIPNQRNRIWVVREDARIVGENRR